MSSTRGVGGINSYSYDLQFRSPIESDRLNDAFADIVDDVGEAFTRADHINSRVSDIRGAMSYQTQQMSIAMGAVSGLIQAAHTHYDANPGGLIYWSAYDENNYRPGTGTHSRYDPVLGEVTLPWSTSWTKVPLYKNEYGEYVADSSASIQLDTGGGLVTITRPNSAYDMVDNNPETTWIAELPIGTAPGSVTGVVSLPNLFSTKFNSIMVSPFPVGGCKVTSLQYFSTSSGGYVNVPSFVPSEYCRRYHFGSVDVSTNTLIKFVLTGTSLYNSNGTLVKVFGMRDIDVALIEYASSSTFVVRLDARGNSIANITYVNVTYDYDNITTTYTSPNRPMLLNISRNEAGTDSIFNSTFYTLPYTGNQIPVGGNSVLWAHITLNKVWGRTAVVRDITVRYN